MRSSLQQQSVKASLTVKKFVTLGLGKERYGIEVGKTREIIARYEIVPLPKTPQFIEGMISLRGDIIPVVDLRKRFELPSRARDSDTRIIVVELNDFTVGIQVDRVYEVLKLSSADIEPPPPLVSGLKAEYLEGVAEVKNTLVTILDLNKIFSTTEQLMLGEASGAAADEAPVHAPAPAPAKAPAEEEAKTVVASADGMVSWRGKSYFVGKKYKGSSLSVKESGGKLRVFFGSDEVKSFDV